MKAQVFDTVRRKKHALAGLGHIPKVYLGEDFSILLNNQYSWQNEIDKCIASEPQARKIMWIMDFNGNKGKSIYVKKQVFEKKAILLSWDDPSHVLYIASQFEGPNTIFFDLTKAKPYKIDTAAFYSNIELLKNGLYVSTKYESKIVCQRIPHIIVFSNQMPHLTSLSIDRWKLGRIGGQSNQLYWMSTEQVDQLVDELNIGTMRKKLKEEFKVYEAAKTLYAVSEHIMNDINMSREEINAFLKNLPFESLPQKEQDNYLKQAKHYHLTTGINAIANETFRPSSKFIQKWGN